MRVMAVGVFAAAALTAGPAPAQITAAGPYYPTPSWDQKLPAATRFVILSNFNSQAVLDRETGLVWERSPDRTEFGWRVAIQVCADKAVGGRKGWRLPSVIELASLIDPTVAFPSPVLPLGHPFIGLVEESAGGAFYSATADAANPGFLWMVRFKIQTAGDPNVFTSGGGTEAPGRTWCVRGGMNAEAY